jgi:hypothetical protein
MRGVVRYPVLCALGLCLWASCKTPAPPPEMEPEPPREVPRYALVFEGVEAESPARVSLRYTLRGENRAAGEAGIAIRGWGVLLNGEDAPLSSPAGAGAVLRSAAGEGSALVLDLGLTLPEDGGDFDEYHVELTLHLAGTAGDIPVAAEAVFPGYGSRNLVSPPLPF